MRRNLYYHVYLTDNPGNWGLVVLEQMKAMEDSGLLSSIDILNVNVVARENSIDLFNKVLTTDINTPGRLEIAINVVANPYKTDAEMLENIDSPDTPTEKTCFDWIYDDCWNSHEDLQVGYVHTKGITSFETFDKDPEKFKKYYYWRQYLNYGVIENWKKCTDALTRHDTAGIGYYNTPCKHYSGGFWWSKADHIVKLRSLSDKSWWIDLKKNTSDAWLRGCSDRFSDEMWLLNAVNTYTYSDYVPKCFNLIQIPQAFNPAACCLSKAFYKDL